MRQGTKLSDSQIFHFLSQWRVKSDEGVLMALLFPMSQTFINWGNTSNLVWEAGPASPPFGLKTLTPPQSVWCWGQPCLLPYSWPPIHGQKISTDKGRQSVDHQHCFLSFCQLLILNLFFLSLPKFPACVYVFEAEWWFLRTNLMMWLPCLKSPSSHLLGPVWTSSFGVKRTEPIFTGPLSVHFPSQPSTTHNHAYTHIPMHVHTYIHHVHPPIHAYTHTSHTHTFLHANMETHTPMYACIHVYIHADNRHQIFLLQPLFATSQSPPKNSVPSCGFFPDLKHVHFHPHFSPSFLPAS